MPSLFPLGSSLVYFDSANNSTLFAHCISCKFGVPFVSRNTAHYVLDNIRWALWCERYAIPHDDVINLITNLFRVTGPLWGESTGHRWIPFTKASDAELWCFFALYLDKRLSKPWGRRWFETSSRPLWRHCNEHKYICVKAWYQYVGTRHDFSRQRTRQQQVFIS